MGPRRLTCSPSAQHWDKKWHSITSIRDARTGGASTRSGRRRLIVAVAATGIVHTVKKIDSISTAAETTKRMPTDDELNSPYVIVVELMCALCLEREMTQLPYGVMLKHLDCSGCGERGYMLTTGQPIYGDQEIGTEIMPGEG